MKFVTLLNKKIFNKITNTSKTLSAIIFLKLNQSDYLSETPFLTPYYVMSMLFIRPDLLYEYYLWFFVSWRKIN